MSQTELPSPVSSLEPFSSTNISLESLSSSAAHADANHLPPRSCRFIFWSCRSDRAINTYRRHHRRSGL